MIVIVPDEIVLANVVTDFVHYEVISNVVDKQELTRENYIALATLTARMGSAYVSYQELQNGIPQCEAYSRDIQVVKHSLRQLNLINLLDRAVVKRAIYDFLEKIGATHMTLHTNFGGVQRTQHQYRIGYEVAELLSTDDKMMLVSLRTNHGV